MKQEITQFIGKVKLGAKKNAPELLLAGALVTGTATVVLTGIASAKAADVRKDFLEAKMSLEYETQFGDITDEEVKSKVKEIYLKYGLSLVRDYAIPVGLYGATVGMIFASYRIQKNSHVALSTALAARTAAYNTLIGKLPNGASFGLTAKEV